MGKASRIKARDRRTGRHIKVVDAAQVIAMAEQWDNPQLLRSPIQGERWIAGVAHFVLEEWRKTRVVLRADLEFVGALLNSDTNVELVPDWLDRSPFNSVAFSFPEPISLHDGDRLCHYHGFIAAGIRSGSPEKGAGDMQRVYTRYGPLPWGDGVRFLWVFNVDGDPTTHCQTVSMFVRGEHAKPDIRTLADLIKEREAGSQAFGFQWGKDELAALVPISVQLMLYLTATEPDLDWLPPEQIRRPHQLQAARVGNVGWRVGSAMRTWRRGQPAAPTGRRLSGWRLPPHIRRAHWHRVRVATRAADGTVVGSRTGVQGVDWNYEMRWYPPTPVNVSDDVPPDPTVREVISDGAR
jgi:hypothetical protein